MGFSIAEGYVEFGTKGLGAAEKACDSLVGKFRGLLGAGNMTAAGIGGAIGGMAATAVLHLADNLREAVAETFRLGAEAEVTAKHFAAMAGDAAVGKKLLGDLREVFAGSSIPKEQYQALAGKMLSEGAKSEQIVEDLRQIAMLAQGSGESFDGMANALERAEMSGKVTIRTLMAMQPVAKRLADVYGVDVDRINEMAESGQIGLKQLRWAMADLTREGGRFDTDWKTRKETLVGAWAQLTSATKRYKASLLEGMETPLAKILNALTSCVNMTTELGALGEKLADRFGPFLEILSQAAVYMKEITDWVRKINSMMPALPGGKSLTSSLALTPDKLLWKAVTFPATVIKDWALSKITDKPAYEESTPSRSNKAPELEAGKGGAGTSFVSFAQLAEKMQMEASRANEEANLRTASGVEKLAGALQDGAVKVVVTAGNILRGNPTAWQE